MKHGTTSNNKFSNIHASMNELNVTNQIEGHLFIRPIRLRVAIRARDGRRHALRSF